MPFFASGQFWDSVKSCLAVESVLRLCVRGRSCSCSGCAFVNANGRCLLGLECEGAAQEEGGGRGGETVRANVKSQQQDEGGLGLPSFSVYVYVCV